MTRNGIRITITAALLVISGSTTLCFAATDLTASDLAAPDLAAPDLAAPDFASVADGHEAATLADRRHLHEFPELSGREFETQAYLRDRITETAGVELIDGDWGTGLV
jgi:hypothetical protein